MKATSPFKIHVIEDEEDITELLRYNLTKEGFSVSNSYTGREGMAKLEEEIPDLLLLDLMLPDTTGIDICRKIKSNPKFSQLAVIMLTAKGEEEDIVKGLNAGADDYVTKPFSPRVLIARINSVLKRTSKDEIFDEEKVVDFKELYIDPRRHLVKNGERKLDLSRTEFQILHLLASRAGWVFTRSQIVDAINGVNHAVTNRSVDVQVVGIRKKLGEVGHLIETVRGVGYRFKEVEFDSL